MFFCRYVCVLRRENVAAAQIEKNKKIFLNFIAFHTILFYNISEKVCLQELFHAVFQLTAVICL